MKAFSLQILAMETIVFIEKGTKGMKDYNFEVKGRPSRNYGGLVCKTAGENLINAIFNVNCKIGIPDHKIGEAIKVLRDYLDALELEVMVETFGLGCKRKTAQDVCKDHGIKVWEVSDILEQSIDKVRDSLSCQKKLLELVPTMGEVYQALQPQAPSEDLESLKSENGKLRAKNAELKSHARSLEDRNLRLLKKQNRVSIDMMAEMNQLKEQNRALEALIAKKDKARDKMLAEKNEIIAERDKALEEKDAVIADLNDLVQTKDAVHAELLNRMDEFKKLTIGDLLEAREKLVGWEKQSASANQDSASIVPKIATSDSPLELLAKVQSDLTLDGIYSDWLMQKLEGAGIIETKTLLNKSPQELHKLRFTKKEVKQIQDGLQGYGLSLKLAL